ncbi:MAG: hypothetical protein ACREVO_21010, partial [Steroidobacteraceae bacterium]
LTAWRKGGHLSDESAVKLAELAGLDPVETVLRIAAERNGGISADIFRRALARLAPIAASILLALGLLFGGAAKPVSAAVAHLSSAQTSLAPIYIMRSNVQWH